MPRILAANLISLLAMHRALMQHMRGRPRRWDKTAHTFPADWNSR